MPALTYLTWALWVSAAAFLALGALASDWSLVVPAIGAALASILIMALNEIIKLLTAIKDRVTPQDTATVATLAATDTTPPRPIEDVARDIDRMRLRQTS